MPIAPTYPGVYVQEESSGVRTITGVSTSVAAFIGMVNRGPLAQPTSILSYADYERAFGEDTSLSQMTDQVKQFFLNGGKQAYVMRIANGAAAAEVTVQNEFNTPVLVFTAKEAGEIGDTIRIEIDYDTSSPESSFNLRVFRHESDGQGGLEEVEEELFSGLTMDSSSGLYAVDVITQQSALINAALATGFTPSSAAFKGYALAGRTFADATDFQTEIHTAILAMGGTGHFRISVDGSPFVDVSVTTAQIGAVDPIADFTSRINVSLLAYGLTVAASLVPGPNGRSYLLIRSATSSTAGSVVLRRGASADIAEAMHFGLDDGGLEVDGFAHARPAPTGMFYRPGNLDSTAAVGWLAALTAFADQDPTNLDTFTLTDSAGSFSNAAPFVVSLGNPIVVGTGVESLANVAAAIDVIVDSINATADATADFNWTAVRHGFRLVITPDYGDANTTGTFATSPTYDLGAAGNGFDQPNVALYSLNASAAMVYQSGTGGIDGVAPIADDYEDAFTTIDREVDLFNLMILPLASTQTDSDMESIWGMASVFCQQSRAFLIVDPRSTWTDADDS